MEISLSLKEKLKELRGKRSLFEVEKGTGLARIEISRYEQGKYAPSPKNLEKLAKFYDIPYEELRMYHYNNYFSDPREKAVILAWAKRLLNLE